MGPVYMKKIKRLCFPVADLPTLIANTAFQNPAENTFGKMSFGSFELNHTVAPRYFKVSYVLDQRRYREKVLDNDTKEIAIEHREQV